MLLVNTREKSDRDLVETPPSQGIFFTRTPLGELFLSGTQLVTRCLHPRTMSRKALQYAKIQNRA